MTARAAEVLDDMAMTLEILPAQRPLPEAAVSCRARTVTQFSPPIASARAQPEWQWLGNEFT